MYNCMSLKGTDCLWPQTGIYMFFLHNRIRSHWWCLILRPFWSCWYRVRIVTVQGWWFPSLSTRFTQPPSLSWAPCRSITTWTRTTAGLWMSTSSTGLTRLLNNTASPESSASSTPETPPVRPCTLLMIKVNIWIVGKVKMYFLFSGMDLESPMNTHNRQYNSAT